MKAIKISSEKNCLANSDSSTLFWLLLLKLGTRLCPCVAFKAGKRNFTITLIAQGIELHILPERSHLNVEIIEWFQT